MPVEFTKEGTILRVYVQPRSSRPGVGGVREGALRVKLSSPPIENRANRELVEVLSESLDVAKNEVEIVGGQKGRRKRVLVRGLSPSDVRERLGL